MRRLGVPDLTTTVLALSCIADTNGDGSADVTMRFGGTVATGDAGGTGIALYRDGLFAETNDRIVRYEMTPGSIVPKGAPQTVVSGLPLTGDHPMHPIAIDADGNLYVNLGSATNSCQKENRMLNSAGVQPCTELPAHAWTPQRQAERTFVTAAADRSIDVQILGSAIAIVLEIGPGFVV